MKGTYTTLYFSWKYDADLLEIYRQVGRKDFVKIMKESLRMLIRPGYDPPTIRRVILYPYASAITPKEEVGKESAGESMYLVVTFSAASDRDVYELLKQVVSGKLGLFVKNAMRMALGPYFVLGRLLNGGDGPLNAAYRESRMFFVHLLESPGTTKENGAISVKDKAPNNKGDFTESKTKEVKEVGFAPSSEVVKGGGENPPLLAPSLEVSFASSLPSYEKANAVESNVDIEEITPASAPRDLQKEELSEDDVLSLLDNL